MKVTRVKSEMILPLQGQLFTDGGKENLPSR